MNWWCFILKQLNFIDYKYFAEEIVKKVESLDDKYDSVTVIAKYDETRELIKNLIGFDYDIASIELHMEDFKGYCDEYITSINQNNEIWCEPFKRDGKYFNNIAVEIYILSNCSSKVISHCESNYIYEVLIGEDVDEECTYALEDEKIHGFTVSKSDDQGYHSYSFYTSDDLSKEDIQDILKMI